jgi:hypothetical protein
MPVDQIRVASWNLRRGCADLDLLQAQDPALVLAQEVTAAAFADLRRRCWLPAGATWWSILSRRGRCSPPTSR